MGAQFPVLILAYAVQGIAAFICICVAPFVLLNLNHAHDWRTVVFGAFFSLGFPLVTLLSIIRSWSLYGRKRYESTLMVAWSPLLLALLVFFITGRK